MNWKITEKSETHFCAEDPNGYWKVYQKWGGCLEITRSMNRPIDEAEADDITTMHICDLDRFVERLSELAALTQIHLPNTDAAKNAARIVEVKP